MRIIDRTIPNKILITLGLIWLLVGCGANTADTTSTASGTKPTVVPLIRSGGSANVAQVSSMWAATPTSMASTSQNTPADDGKHLQQNLMNLLTATPTSPATATPEPTPTLQPGEAATPTPVLYREVVIYDDELNANWTLENSQNVNFDALSTDHWFETLDKETELDSGAVSVAVKPDGEWNKLYFTVRADAIEAYPRDEVQGVNIWLNSGNNYLSNDGLVVAIVGSNDKTYWLSDDKSVLTRETSYFPEIPLYDLGVQARMPPNSWVSATLWMDQLRFGPDYIHVTGIYINNKYSLQSPFYIDKVTLLLSPQ